jgi:FMN-dependent oxidoreductase (nitrilotriacetate monooxygenase family)
VLYKLWEKSWDDDAVLLERDTGRYIEPSKVHAIGHAGEHFQVPGMHLCQPSPQRTPVLFQAGSSGRGQAFAARHAECVFVSQQERGALRKLVSGVRDDVEREGRQRDDIKFFMGMSIVTAPTEHEAREKYEDYMRYANPEAGLAHYASSSGIDFSRYAPNEPIRYVKNNAIQSVVKNLTAAGRERTVADILSQELQLGGRYPTLVGSASQVADELVAWIEDTGIDGFNLARTVTPECYRDFVELVVPELQARGAYKTEYAEGTLREKIFGAGRAYLPDAHAGAAKRHEYDKSSVKRTA